MGRTKASIVVGVDGTPGSRLALGFAVREAAERGSPVEVVTVWNRAVAGDQAAPGRTRAQAQQVQDEAVTEALANAPRTPIVSRQLVEGIPGPALLMAARAAAYLVLGSTHIGASNRALLGSVGEYCAQRAGCPVVVIPSPALRARPRHRGCGRPGRCRRSVDR